MGVVHTTAEGEVVSGTTEIPESGTELVKGEWQDPLLALISSPPDVGAQEIVLQ